MNRSFFTNRSFFRRRYERAQLLRSIGWGLGGLAVGAAVTYFLTSATRVRLTQLIRRALAQRLRHARHDAQLQDAQIEQMENEGGVSHVVRAAPSSQYAEP